MLRAEARDPTAGAGPRGGAGNLRDVDVTVFLKIVVEPSESSEKFGLPTLSTSRRLWLGITVRRGEPHADGFGCRDLLISQLARAKLHTKTGDPQPDPPREPFFMSFGVRVAMFPGICRQACQATVEVDAASAHSWSLSPCPVVDYACYVRHVTLATKGVDQWAVTIPSALVREARHANVLAATRCTGT